MTVTEIGGGPGAAGPVTAGAAQRGGLVVAPVGEGRAFAALMEPAKVKDAGSPGSAKGAGRQGTGTGDRQGKGGPMGTGGREDRIAESGAPAPEATAPVLAGPTDDGARPAAMSPPGDDVETSAGSAAPRRERQVDADAGAESGPSQGPRDAQAAPAAPGAVPPALHAPGSRGAGADAEARTRDRRSGGLPGRDGPQEGRHVGTPAARAVAASEQGGVPNDAGKAATGAGAASGQPTHRAPMVPLDEAEFVPLRAGSAKIPADHPPASQAQATAVAQAREPSHKPATALLHTPSLAGSRPNHPREADAEEAMTKANAPPATLKTAVDQAVAQEMRKTDLGSSRLSNAPDRQGGSVDKAVNATAPSASQLQSATVQTLLPGAGAPRPPGQTLASQAEATVTAQAEALPRHPPLPPQSFSPVRMPAMEAGALLAAQAGTAARKSARNVPLVRETDIAFTRADARAAFADAPRTLKARPAAPSIPALVFTTSPTAAPALSLAAVARAASDRAALGDTALAASDLRAATLQTASPAAPVAAGAAAHHVPRQIALRIAQAAEGGAGIPRGTVELSLSPEELGRVRLRLHPSEAGLSVTITAERAETLDLMRRNIDILEREFLEIGYEGAQFDFAQGGQGGPGAENGSGVPGTPAPSGLNVAAPDRTQPAQDAPLLLGERLDIRL